MINFERYRLAKGTFPSLIWAVNEFDCCRDLVVQISSVSEIYLEQQVLFLISVLFLSTRVRVERRAWPSRMINMIVSQEHKLCHEIRDDEVNML